MRRLDRHFQPCVLLGARQGPADPPGMVATSGHLQDPTEQGHGILRAQRRHACVPGSCTFAAYAVACFKMSRSIRASASSRFSRETLASSSAMGRRLSPSVASWPRRTRNTQFASVLTRHRQSSRRLGNCSLPVPNQMHGSFPELLRILLPQNLLHLTPPDLRL